MFPRIAVSPARRLNATVLLLAVLAAGCAEPAALEVNEARLRAPIPGQDKTVGYFTARNSTDQDIVLTGASSTAARAIEMHTTIRDGDIVRMRRLPEVVISAHDTVRFEPGGRHLMVFGVSELGTDTEIVLETAGGERFQVSFETTAVGSG
jgi:periplasmic copper chaperone A